MIRDDGARLSPIDQALSRWLGAGRRVIGQIAIDAQGEGFILRHREDEDRDDLENFIGAEQALTIARFDEKGNYRPLKTAPNLRRGWRLKLSDISTLRAALDFFYPGRLAVFMAFTRDELHTTPLRNTLERQSGMYRVAAKISDEQINNLVGNFCRSDGGCLRTILWKRDESGARASTKLAPEKFDPAYDQAESPVSAGHSIPLLCQEACNLLVAEARQIVKPIRETP